MFTGLIRHLGKVISWNPDTNQLKIKCETLKSSDFEDGDSIAINGICLTVVNIVDVSLSHDYNFIDFCEIEFHVMKETQSLTSIHNWKKDDIMNIEPAMTFDKNKLDGHLLRGHIHTTGFLSDQINNKWWFTFQYPVDLEIKGSIAIDGISLTIVDVETNRFSVCLIPHTISHTNFQSYKIGTKVNLEFDTEIKMNDKSWMKLAMIESHKGKQTAPPNPWVGCILVNEQNQVISTGFHEKPGSPHAEVNALSLLNTQELFTLYVTLEPCCHTGRTPPCTDLLIQYKERIKRVVVGILDPDERVAGNGVNILKQNGIHVDVLNDDDISWDLRTYIHQRKYSSSYKIFKIATTLDLVYTGGKITSDQGFQDVHKERNFVQSIFTTTKTYNIDRSKLTVRLSNQPERILPTFIVGDTYVYKQREYMKHIKRSELNNIWNQYLSCYIESGVEFFDIINEDIHEVHWYIEHKLSTQMNLGEEEHVKKFIPKHFNFYIKEQIQLSPTTTKIIYLSKKQY